MCTSCTGLQYASTTTGTSCSTSTDTHAVTVDSTSGLALTCVANYSPNSANICTIQSYARFLNYDAGGNDILFGKFPTKSSEGECAQLCSASNADHFTFGATINGINAHICKCKQNEGSAAAMTQSTPYNSNIVGTCAMYKGSYLNCQDVIYGADGSCSVVGGGACSCRDSAATTCDTTSGASTACVASQGPSNGICGACNIGTYNSGGFTACKSGCPDPNASSCTTSGASVNCAAGYGLVGTVCQSCSTNTYNLGGSPTCSASPDSRSVTINPKTGSSLTCNKYYALGSGLNGAQICQAYQFARYLGNIGGDIEQLFNSAFPETEGACINACLANNVEGVLATVTWSKDNGCLCRKAPALASLTFTSGFEIKYLIGSCQDYASLIPFAFVACQNVNLLGSKCNGVDGSACTVVKCTDIFANTCNPATPKVSTSCVGFYTLFNGVCKLTNFARFIDYGVYGQEIVASQQPTELACYNYCTANSGNTPTTAFQSSYFNPFSSQPVCYCKYGASTGYKTFYNVSKGQNGLSPFVAGGVGELAGSCALYADQLKSFTYTCKDAVWSSTGCIGCT